MVVYVFYTAEAGKVHFYFLPFNCCSTAVVLSAAINVIILLGLSPKHDVILLRLFAVYQSDSVSDEVILLRLF